MNQPIALVLHYTHRTSLFLPHVHAAQLLQSVYDDLTPDPRVLDITVEEPSDEFCALRDFVDCRNALKMACFQPPAVHEGFGAEMERECKERLKLHKVRGGGELWIKGRWDR